MKDYLVEYAQSQGESIDEFIEQVRQYHRDLLLQNDRYFEESKNIAFLTGIMPTPETFCEACNSYLNTIRYDLSRDKFSITEDLVNYSGRPLDRIVAETATKRIMRNISRPGVPSQRGSSIIELERLRRLASEIPKKEGEYTNELNINEGEAREIHKQLLADKEFNACVDFAKASGFLPNAEDLYTALLDRITAINHLFRENI